MDEFDIEAYTRELLKQTSIEAEANNKGSPASTVEKYLNKLEKCYIFECPSNFRLYDINTNDWTQGFSGEFKEFFIDLEKALGDNEYFVITKDILFYVFSNSDNVDLMISKLKYNINFKEKTTTQKIIDNKIIGGSVLC